MSSNTPNVPDMLITCYTTSDFEQSLYDRLSLFFSQHYGVYEANDRGEKHQVRLGSIGIRNLLSDESAEVWVASGHGDEMLGYACVIRCDVDVRGESNCIVTWVTQLVVHSNHRKLGIAKRLLQSIWSFSDHFAWGLVTANPFAVRALEKATRRRCSAKNISDHQESLLRLGKEKIQYIRKSLGHRIDDRQSVIDTSFPVDHSEIPDMIRKVSQDQEWQLGDIQRGEEWFAFTTRDQEPFPITSEELELMLADSDKVVIQAYKGMALNPNHAWMRGTVRDVDFIVKQLNLRPDSRILDLGSGTGRHSIELARRGYSVVGVDLISSWVDAANAEARESGLDHLVSFVHHDCRDLNLGEAFDAVICLYDVIGSYPEDINNQLIVNSISRHLRQGGMTLTSVMSLAQIFERAEHFSIAKNPDKLLQLKPSQTMQDTGNVFNPDFLLLDPYTRIVYRKEQFVGNTPYPQEMLVRDQRYFSDDLRAMFEREQIQPIWTRHVRAGGFDVPLKPTHDRAKELLLLGVKS